jgi:hypothetical protein
MAKLKCARPVTIAGLNGLDGVRKIESVTDTVGIYKDSDTQEFIVKVKGKPEQDYFAADRQDAEATALEMVSQHSPVIPVEYEDLNHVRRVTSGRWTMREKELVFAIPHISPYAFVSQRRMVGGVPELFSWKRGESLPHRQYLAPEFIAPVMVALDQYLTRQGSQLGALGALGARSLNFDPTRVNYQDAIDNDFDERASQDDDEPEEEDDGTDSKVDREDDELVVKARQHQPRSLEAKFLPTGTEDELIFYSSGEEDAARFPNEISWNVKGNTRKFVITLRTPGLVFYGREGARLPLATAKSIELNLPAPTQALPALAPSAAMRAIRPAAPKVEVKKSAVEPVKVVPRQVTPMVRRVVGGQTQIVSPVTVVPPVTVAEVANVVNVAPAPVAPESRAATAIERKVAKVKKAAESKTAAAQPVTPPLAQPRKKLSQMDKGSRPKREVLPVTAAQRAINDERLKNSLTPDFIAKFTPPLGSLVNGAWVANEWPATTPMSAMEVAKDALEGGQMLYDGGERALTPQGGQVAWKNRVSRFVARHYRTKLESHVELERFGLGISHLVIDIERLRLRLEQARGDAVEVETIDRQGRAGRLTFSRSIAAAFAAWCARLGNSQLGKLGGLGAGDVWQEEAEWFGASASTSGMVYYVSFGVNLKFDSVRIVMGDHDGPNIGMSVNDLVTGLRDDDAYKLDFLDPDWRGDIDEGAKYWLDDVNGMKGSLFLLTQLVERFKQDPKKLGRFMSLLNADNRVWLDELYENGTLQGLARQGLQGVHDITDMSITVDAIEWDRNWRAERSQDRTPKKVGPVSIRLHILAVNQARKSPWAWSRLGVTVTRPPGARVSSVSTGSSDSGLTQRMQFVPQTASFSTVLQLFPASRASSALFSGERVSFVNADHSFEFSEADRQGLLIWIDRMKELGLLRDPAETSLPPDVHY